MTLPLEAAPEAALDPHRIPRHVAIIMGGNRRWARAHGLPAVEGHRRGLVALRDVTRAAGELGVRIVTAYGFSTEHRLRDENHAMCLAKTELAQLDGNVRVRILGHWNDLPPASREALVALEEQTASNCGVVLNLAVNYSSRSELERAVRTISGEVAAGRLRVEAIDETCISAYLDTAGTPDPDLLIRPGGERRLSNFLLYQAAYTELVMCDVNWPDFSRADFERALREYQSRQRRYGS